MFFWILASVQHSGSILEFNAAYGGGRSESDISDQTTISPNGVVVQKSENTSKSPEKLGKYRVLNYKQSPCL